MIACECCYWFDDTFSTSISSISLEIISVGILDGSKDENVEGIGILEGSTDAITEGLFDCFKDGILDGMSDGS